MIMRNIIFLFIFAACNGNNFLYLAPNDKATGEIIKTITSDVNEKLGCKIWSLDRDKVKLDDKTMIERRPITIARNSHELSQYNGGKDLGVFDYINNQIFYSERMDFETWSEGIKFVLMHELGHAMGLDHTPDTVMNDNYKFMPYDEALQSLIDLLNTHNKNQCDMLKE